MAKRRGAPRAPAAPARPAPPPPAPRQPRPAAPTALPALPWTAHLLPLGGIVALALALYWPAIDGAFVYDDPNAISQSQLIRRLTPLSRFVTLSTRPLTDFSFAVNYAVGELAPRSFHLTSMLLHAACAVLLYLVAVRTLALPVLAARYGAARLWIATAAAALFAAHPLASESVAYVSSRSEVLASMFYLAALLAYAIAATTRSRAAVIALPLAAAAGLGSKEIAVTIPFALALYDWLFIAGQDRRRFAQRRRLIALAAAPLAFGLVLIVGRALLAPSGLGAYGATAGLAFDRFSRWEYLMTQFGVLALYLRLTVAPVGQTFDYDWPLARSPLAPGVWLPLLALLALVAAAWRWRRREPLFAFAVAWTFLVLAPTSSLMPIADLAVERRMYLPLAGLTLFAAAGLWDLCGLAGVAARARLIGYGLVVAGLVAGAGLLTVARATLWGDAIALHEDGVAKAPGNPRVRLNLGVTYLNLGQADRALDTLRVAKQLYDQGESVQAFPRIGAFIHYNLGAVLYTRKDYAQAEPQLRRSLELGNQYLALRPMGNLLLARIAQSRGDLPQAISRMQEALKHQDVAGWRVELAQMQWTSGDRDGAILTLRGALLKFPDNKRARDLLNRIKAEKAPS